MASKALQTFDHAIRDAVDLLDHFDALNKQPPPPEIEVLKRASLVMALAALETYFEDLLLELVESLCSQNNTNERLSEFFRVSLTHDLKVFHTPSADRVKPIFMKYLGYDITEGWFWNNCDPAKARAELNRLAKKRGDIAHRSWRPLPGQPTQHAVTRDAMRKHVHFIKELARVTDSYVQESANKSNSFAPVAPGAIRMVHPIDVSGDNGQFCSFCGKSPDEYAVMFKNAGFGICNHCLTVTNEIIGSNNFKRLGCRDTCACSFCAKRQLDGVSLIAGPEVFICNECSAHFYRSFTAKNSE
jgi:hypothetical protein